MELASAIFLCGKPCGDGTASAAFDGRVTSSEVINQKFFISGFKGLLNKSPNMDTLVALGSGASFLYSVYALFAMTDAHVKGDMAAVMAYIMEILFSEAMIYIDRVRQMLRSPERRQRMH